MQTDMTAIIILLGSFALLLILKVPITLSLIVSSILTGWYLKVPLTVVVQRMFGGIQNFSLLAIPFFILAGGIMAYGGITNRIIEFSNIIIGRVRGGLAQVNVLASMFFGGISGSAVADVSSVGVMLIAVRRKYPKEKRYSFKEAARITKDAVIYALLVTIFVYRTMTDRKFIKILHEGLKTLAIMMSLIAAARALVPFYIMMLVVLLLITFVSFFSTFIPDLIMPELVAG